MTPYLDVADTQILRILRYSAHHYGYGTSRQFGRTPTSRPQAGSQVLLRECRCLGMLNSCEGYHHLVIFGRSRSLQGSRHNQRNAGWGYQG